MTPEELQAIKSRVGKIKGASVPKLAPSYSSDDDEDIPVGVHGLLAASEKLLAVNRGLVPPDARDSQQYKKLFTTSALLGERIKMDASKIRLNTLRRAARIKRLDGIHAGVFDSYAEGQLIGNPLSMPLEEINPIALLEQSRRVTQMGPGGLGSAQSITDESRNVHPSQFGFLSPIEGPESDKAGVDTRLAWGTKIDPRTGKVYQRFRDPRTGNRKWMSPGDVSDSVIKLPD